MKIIILLIFLSSIIFSACQKKTTVEGPKIDDVKIIKVEPEDNEILEEWARETEEQEVLGVSAYRMEGEWPWNVFISAAEFIREDPLESELQQSIESALKTVPGVEKVAHEDREVWVVQGNPKGEDLVRVCSKVLDSLSESIRKAIDEL